MISEAAKNANDKWLGKTVGWSVKISNESYPYEAEKLSELKKEKGLVAELFRDFLSNLTDEEIENARLNLEVE
ncbi:MULTISPECIES: hypothetical protein [unclassified Psychrobacter]|uniref:hypothetical protein n=1 Tax=unclassified Psychrobacter TaxID=196806 RepID=UPI001868183F|nr:MULTISPECIES: hypothetical protein [unclassified Psychrobacter]MDN5619703.1 hypothetical protein [Psychrobacter sp.]